MSPADCLTTYFDALDREIRRETQGYDGGTTASRLIYIDTVYNALGQVQRVSRPYYAGDTVVWIDYEYDALGRPIAVSAPDDNSQPATTSISYLGLTVSATNANGQTSSRTMNAIGQVVQITDAAQNTLTHAYDPFGNLVRVTDALGNVTTLGYDGRSRKTSMLDPDMGTWTYAYNVLGELVRQTNARGEVTNMTYDLLGRQLTRSEPSLSSTWRYDRYANGTLCWYGNLCEVSSGNGYSSKHTYDTLGRWSSTTETIGKAFTYGNSYDTNGRVERVTGPVGAYVNTYSPLGYLKNVRLSVSDTGYFWQANAVDAQGRVTDESYRNGERTTYSFSPATGRLTGQATGLASPTVQNTSYSYDSLGNLTARADAITGVSASYAYDALNRLTTETRSGGALTSAQVIGFSYDAIGNIRSRTEAGTSAVFNYPASGAGSIRPHALSSVSGVVNGVANPSYSYDAAGNMTTATGRGVIGWTSFDKVSSIARTVGSNQGKLDYMYDANLERVREVYSVGGIDQRTTYYLHPPGGSGLLYEEETTSSGWKKRFYISAGNKTVATLQYTSAGGNGEFQYWHTDRLGSTEAVTSTTGAVVERLAYEPFGKRRNTNGTSDPNGTLSATSTDRGYTGHEMMDEVGLVNMNGRIYDPAVSRFLSADPFVTDPSDPQSYNRYSYVRNAPARMTDPSGYRDFELPPIVVRPPVDRPDPPEKIDLPRPGDRDNPPVANPGGGSTPPVVSPSPVPGTDPGTVNPPTPPISPTPTPTPVVVGPTYTAQMLADQPAPWSVARFCGFCAEAIGNFMQGFSNQYRSVMEGPSLAYSLGWGTRVAFDYGLIASDVLNSPIWPGPDVGLAGVAGIASRSVAAKEVNYVYRGLAEGEDVAAGLSARAPGAGNSPISHIAGKRDTQWISTTKDLNTALEKYGQNGVVRIDLNKVRSEVLDVSGGLAQGGRMSNWARRDQEVLIRNFISPDAIVRIK